MSVIARCDFRHCGLNRLADDRTDIHRLAFQVELSLGDARYLEKVVNQPRHVLYLAVDHLAHLDQHRIVRSVALQNRDGGPDRRERVAELMRQDRQKIILPPVRIQQLAVRLLEAPVQLGKFSRLLALKLPVGCVELGVRLRQRLIEALQLEALAVQFHEHRDLAAQDFRHHWHVNVVHRAKLVAFQPVQLAHMHARHEDDRRAFEARMLVDQPRGLEPDPSRAC